MRHSTRRIRRRGNTDKWEVILTHKDPLTGELLPTYHTVEAATKKQAKKKSYRHSRGFPYSSSIMKELIMNKKIYELHVLTSSYIRTVN